MKKLLFAVMFLFGASAYAQEVSLPAFLLQLMDAIKQMGGLGTMAVIASVLTLLISSMKVSALAKYTWEKLPELAKALAAPVLALMLGVVMLGMDGKTLNLASAAAYLFAGAGAVFLHQILDGLKTIPGLGKGMQVVIDLLEAALGGK